MYVEYFKTSKNVLSGGMWLLMVTLNGVDIDPVSQ